MEKRVLDYIIENHMIIAGDRVLIGVSGGADSLALLYFLDKYQDELKIELGVAHLNHQLRGIQADEDETLVMEFCEKRLIPFFSTKKNIRKIAKEKKISIEEAGRCERYFLFEKLAEKEHFNKIALGHHLNDQAETLLLRLIRGTGIKGISGMEANRNNLLIRPFLFLPKNELIEYCQINNLSYRTDASNFEKEYTRNQLRLEIMPLITEINKRAEQHFFEFTKIAHDYEEFLNDYVNGIEDEIIFKKNGAIYFNREKWLKEKSIVQTELLRRGINQFKGSLKEIEYNHIIALQNLIKNDKTTGEIHLPLGIKAIRRYDDVRIEKRINKVEKLFSPHLIIPNKTYIISFFRIIIETELLGNYYFEKDKNNSLNQKNHSEKYFDYDKMGGDLYLRRRETGDFFYPPGLSGKKTIKKFLIDKKVEREKRDNVPILAVENEVIWIIGYSINERLLMDETSKNVLKIKITFC